MPFNSQRTTTCDTVQISALPPGGALVKIGGKELDPSPFVNIAQEKYLVGTQAIGGVWKITLNGTIVGSSFDDVNGQVKDMLDSYKDHSCVSVIIKCSSNFIDGFGKITSLSFSEGTQPSWVNLASYSMEIELYENFGSPVVPPTSGIFSSNNDLYLQSYNENFSINVDENTFSWDLVPSGSGNYTIVGNQHLSVTFNMSATGISGVNCSQAPSPGSYYGLKAAEEAIVQRLGDIRSLNLTNLTQIPDTPDDAIHSITDTLNDFNNGAKFLEFRSVNINTIEHSIELTGEMIIRPSGCLNPNLFTTMTVEENVDGEGRTVTISGTVKALYDTGFDNDDQELIKYYKFNCDSTVLAPNNQTERMSIINSYMNDLSANTNLLAQIANDLSHRRNGTEDYLSDSCSITTTNDPCCSGEPQCVNPSSSPSNNDKDACEAVGGTWTTCPNGSPSAPQICDLRLISSQISRDYGNGAGNFSFTLSNKANCGVIGAKRVEVDVSHEYPSDNIVEIVIPGRGSKGVLIQNICCKTAEKYSITINATLNSNLCGYNKNNFQTTREELKDCINNILLDLEKTSGTDVSCWFVVSNTADFGNTTYRVNKQYVKPSCP